ncbi:hypothetical protein Fmac_030169 [Flemingia macrophylla]|uniref:Uncharacterized protein n=1 Tax=Flemingia macrophylla TaxID=520843 RepID=A0ABD1LE23_9FABA
MDNCSYKKLREVMVCLVLKRNCSCYLLVKIVFVRDHNWLNTPSSQLLFNKHSNFVVRSIFERGREEIKGLQNTTLLHLILVSL